MKRIDLLPRKDLERRVQKYSSGDLVIFGQFWISGKEILRCADKRNRLSNEFGKDCENRPLRGTRIFLLLYPFRSKKSIARKNISKTKEKSAKIKKMREQASKFQEQLIKTILQ